MRNILLLFLLVSFHMGKSQTTYAVYQVPFLPQSDSQMTVLTGMIDDLFYSQPVNIGFPFRFFGNQYESVYIHSNGYVTFNFPSSSSFNLTGIIAPSTELAANAIFCPTMDLNPGLGGQIKYKTVGTAPNRIFTVNYTGVPTFGNSTAELTSQLQLFEESNNIEIHITNKSIDTLLGTSGWPNYAIEGIQNMNKNVAYVVPGRNGNGIWEASNDAWRFDPDSLINYVSYIEGNVFMDANGNCQVDSMDYPVSGQTIIRNDGWAFTQTDEEGKYRFFVGQGVQRISMNGSSPELPYAQINCPETGNYPQILIEGSAELENYNFYLQPDSICTDLRATLNPVGPLRVCSGNYNHQIISIRNFGWLPANQFTVTLTIPDSVIIQSTEPPADFADGETMSWIVNNSLFFGEMFNLHVYDSLDCMVTGGTQMCMSVSVSTTDDCNNSNNTENLCRIVNDVLNPNQIDILQADSLNFYDSERQVNENNDWYTYRIQFQNTGAGTAQKVVVRDILPPFFDPSSVELLSSSHTCILGNASNSSSIFFIHNNINLPDSSSNYNESLGSVIFRVKALGTLSPGQEVLNNATVAFDSNSPVATNWSRIFWPSSVNVNQQHAEASAWFFPNPSDGMIQLNGYFSGQISLFDLSGRVCLQKQLNDYHPLLEMDGLIPGMYLISFRDENSNTKVSRLVISQQ